MNKSIKIALFIVVGILVIGLLLIVGKGFLSTFNPGAQIEKAQQKSGQNNQEVVSTNTVDIRGFAFSPNTITIKVGESVTWKNSDLVGHTATADDGSWDTGILSNGDTGSIKFDKPGTYSYHCQPHPQMKGVVVVE